MTFEERKFSRESSLQRQTVCRQLLWKLLILTFAVKIVKVIPFLLCGRHVGRWVCRCIWGISLKPRQHHFATEVPLKLLTFQWISVQEVLLNSDELTFECFCGRWLSVKRSTHYFICASWKKPNLKDMIDMRDMSLKIKLMGPDQCGSVGWAPFHKMKGHQLDSWLGPTPGLRVQSLVGVGAWSMFLACIDVSPLLFLPPFPSLYK